MGRSKPYLGATLNPGHPFAQVLAGAFLFNSRPGLKIPSYGGMPATFTQAGSFGIGWSGHGTLKVYYNNTHYIKGILDANWQAGTEHTLVMRAIFREDRVFGGGSFSDGGYGFYLSGTSFYYCASGSYCSVTWSGDYSSFHQLAVARRGATVEFFEDGVSLGTGSVTASNTLWVGSLFSYDDASPAGSQGVKEVDYAFMFKKALPAGAIAELYHDPAAMWRPSLAVWASEFASVGTTHDMAGTAGCTAAVAGALGLIRPAGGSMTAQAGVDGRIDAVRGLAGSIDAQVASAALLGLDRPLSGAVSAAAGTQGLLGRIRPVAGQIVTVSDLVAALMAGPFLVVIDPTIESLSAVRTVLSLTAEREIDSLTLQRTIHQT